MDSIPIHDGNANGKNGYHAKDGGVHIVTAMENKKY